MRTFGFGHAAGSDWRSVVECCVEQADTHAPGANLGFLYASDVFVGQLDRILDVLRERTGVQQWVGSVGVGICGGAREYLDEPAVAIMLGEFPEGSFEVLPTLRGLEGMPPGPFLMNGARANFAVVHADPRNGQMPALVSALSKKLESGFAVGGLTSSRRGYHQIANVITSGGVSGVLFSGDVVVSTRLTQGCRPAGPRHTITECQRNVIVTLDGRPAFDVLSEDVGQSLVQTPQRLGGRIFAGFPVPGSDRDDYLVRNLVGVDPEAKLVAIGESLREGMPMMFCRRDAASAVEDMVRMLESIKEGLFTRPRGAVYYSCLGRGASLFGPNSEELTLIRQGLGDVPLVGFFCNGEISHDRLYGYTGVLTLFL
jgi:small ligand-binding sensory domain FIST